MLGHFGLFDPLWWRKRTFVGVFQKIDNIYKGKIWSTCPMKLNLVIKCSSHKRKLGILYFWGHTNYVFSYILPIWLKFMQKLAKIEKWETLYADYHEQMRDCAQIIMSRWEVLYPDHHEQMGDTVHRSSWTVGRHCASRSTWADGRHCRQMDMNRWETLCTDHHEQIGGTVRRLSWTDGRHSAQIIMSRSEALYTDHHKQIGDTVYRSKWADGRHCTQIIMRR